MAAALKAGSSTVNTFHHLWTSGLWFKKESVPQARSSLKERSTDFFLLLPSYQKKEGRKKTTAIITIFTFNIFIIRMKMVKITVMMTLSLAERALKALTSVDVSSAKLFLIFFILKIKKRVRKRAPVNVYRR